MGENADTAAPEIEIRQWRALQDTAVKAQNKFAKDLPDDQKVLVKKGDVLRARVIRRDPNNIFITDGLLNGAPLAANIRIIHKPHWTRIEEAPEPVPPVAESEAVLGEPEETPPVETRLEEAPLEPSANAAVDEIPVLMAEPPPPAADPPAGAAPLRPAKQTTARRLRAWFLKNRGS